MNGEEKQADYVIESGIEMPPPPQRGFRGALYPWDHLEIGQSFAVHILPKQDPKQRMKNFQVQCQQAGKLRGRKFVARLIDKSTMRAWRTE
jgi:hypothetical protein